MLFTAHFIGLIAVALIAGVLAGWALIRDPIDGRFEFVVLAAGVVVWTISIGWMMFIEAEEGLLFGYYVQSFLQWVTPALFLLFVISYSRNDRWLDRYSVKFYLAGIPLFFLALTFTEPVHNLLWTDLVMSTDPFGSVTVDDTGPVFYLARLYAYTTLFAGLVILAQIAAHSNQVSKQQVGALGAATLLVVVTSLIQVIGVLPVPGFDYTVIAFGAFYAALGYLALRDPALDIGSLARQRLLESLSTAVIILTADRKIADYNEAATVAYPDLPNHLGESVEEALEELFEEIPDDEDEEPEVVESLTKSIGDEQYEFSVRLSAIEEGDEVKGYGIVLTDVTDLREYARQLEKKSQQLDQFASMVSHDLRAPITTAQTNAGFAIQMAEDEQVVEYSEKSVESLDRAMELVEDLLTLAREGRSIQDRTYVELDDLVTEARETSPLEGHQAEIDVGEVSVYADPERLRTVFENLMRNAVDHVGEDVNVQVGLLDGDKDGFYIEDDGAGIPDDEIDDVFEHGFTTHSDGTGLGLSIVSSIIEAHGWEITAEHGEELGGARFVVEVSEFRED